MPELPENSHDNPVGVSRRAMLTGSMAAGLATWAVSGVAGASGRVGSGLQFALTVSAGTGLAAGPGRAFVIIARASDLSSRAPEPRDNLQDNEPITVPFFGLDVARMRPGKTIVIGDQPGVVGYPLSAVADVPPGQYVVQAFFNTYETDHRSDGSVVQVHWPSGDGGDIWHSPGNVYSTPHTVRLNANTTTIELELDQVIGPVAPIPAGGVGQQGNPVDSANVKHLKIRSALLSAFWGRDVYLGANILLPHGYDDPANAEARYPMELSVGHFPGSNPHGFQESLGNTFSKWWASADAARIISVAVRSENPFYDDSYNVNSANLGPYGDAIDTELLPAIDAAFRTLGTRWSRVVAGGSTGGWIAAATLVFYPDSYAGAWAGYPDPLDFRAHQVIDVYNDDNAYRTENPWVTMPRPAAREKSGDTTWTNEQENSYERAVAAHGRSQGQWDIWQAVFGPQGADGYPAPIWDKATGVIDHTVAAYWKQHMEMSTVVSSNWSTLGPKIAGRLQVYVGTEDTYFLNNGVEFFEQVTDQLSDPAPDFQFLYGVSQPHGWTPVTTAELLTTMVAFVADHAPVGTDTSGWRGNEQPPAVMLPRGRSVVPGTIDDILDGYVS